MDPLTLGIAAVGLGMSLFGGISASEQASKQAQINQQINADEVKVNQQRQQAMVLDASRRQMETFRNTQRARAAGLVAATSQGVNKGSGLAGGQAQATDQGLFNSLGISQNLQIGQNIFGLDNQISGLKSQISASQSSQMTDSAISSFGGDIMKNASTLGNAAKYGYTQVSNGIDLSGIGFNPIKGATGQ